MKKIKPCFPCSSFQFHCTSFPTIAINLIIKVGNFVLVSMFILFLYLKEWNHAMYAFHQYMYILLNILNMKDGQFQDIWLIYLKWSIFINKNIHFYEYFTLGSMLSLNNCLNTKMFFCVKIRSWGAILRSKIRPKQPQLHRIKHLDFVNTKKTFFFPFLHFCKFVNLVNLTWSRKNQML